MLNLKTICALTIMSVSTLALAGCPDEASTKDKTPTEASAKAKDAKDAKDAKSAKATDKTKPADAKEDDAKKDDTKPADAKEGDNKDDKTKEVEADKK